MKLLAMNPLWLGIVLCLGCGAQERLTPEPASGVEGTSSSAGASGNGNDDTWVSGSIEGGAPSTSQLGDTSEGDDDEGYEEAGLEIWTGGSVELRADGGLEGVGEFAMVQVDYVADEEVILCYVSWPIQSVRALDSCRDCAWAFEVETGTLEYEDDSRETCLANGFEPEQFELALLNIGARENDFLMIEQDDWEPVGEINYLQSENIWEYELFVGEDD